MMSMMYMYWLFILLFFNNAPIKVLPHLPHAGKQGAKSPRGLD